MSMPRSTLWAVAAAAIVSLALPAAAEPVRVEDGTLTYRIQHRLKTFDAVIPASAATLELDWGDGPLEGLRFDAAIPLEAFDSGNRLRDEHAAEALELFLYPEASWSVEQVDVMRREPQGPSWSEATLTASGPLTLHGVTEELSVEVRVKRSGDTVTFEAGFPLSLEAFGIERPGLLGVRIQDTVTVQISLRAPAP